MKIELDKSPIDLGFTPVENMFIHTYLALANGDQIKVYLYALSQIYSSDRQEIDNKNIAFEMKLTEGQVIDAWRFWQELGLVEIVGDRYIFKSLRSGYVNQMIGVDDEATNEIDQIDRGNSNDYRNDDFKKLINNIEEFISAGTDLEFPLSKKEIELIEQHIKDFKLTYEFYNYAFPLASVEVNTKNITVIAGVIRNWVMDGATNEEKLNKLLEMKAKPKEGKDTGKKQSSSKKPALEEDDRMSREERKKFIEARMKKRKDRLEEG